jgi:hypothetical protein
MKNVGTLLMYFWKYKFPVTLIFPQNNEFRLIRVPIFIQIFEAI